MRMLAGVAAVAFLAAAPAAFADPQPRYDASGRVCTAEEIATRPIVKVRLDAGRVYKMQMICRTAGEWRMSRNARDEQQRYNDRGLAAMMNTPGYIYHVPRPEGNGPRLR
jgi:hypothetical protein